MKTPIPSPPRCVKRQCIPRPFEHYLPTILPFPTIFPSPSTIQHFVRLLPFGRTFFAACLWYSFLPVPPVLLCLFYPFPTTTFCRGVWWADVVGWTGREGLDGRTDTHCVRTDGRFGGVLHSFGRRVRRLRARYARCATPLHTPTHAHPHLYTYTHGRRRLRVVYG